MTLFSFPGDVHEQYAFDELGFRERFESVTVGFGAISYRDTVIGRWSDPNFFDGKREALTARCNSSRTEHSKHKNRNCIFR